MLGMVVSMYCRTQQQLLLPSCIKFDMIMILALKIIAGYMWGPIVFFPR
jgi:hypothetical protein